MTFFHEYISEIMQIEGGYSDDKEDSGGKTKYGITQELAREYGYTGNMALLSPAMARQIYREEFWDALKLDEIERLCPSIVKELLDTGVNQGVNRSGNYLQSSLNALNRCEKDYKDLDVDGFIGRLTLAALRSYLFRRGSQGELVLLRALNCLQGAHYIELSQERPKDEKFVFGWLLNRVVI